MFFAVHVAKYNEIIECNKVFFMAQFIILQVINFGYLLLIRS